MATSAEDAAREERIDMEIVVDAYGEDERAMGWYCYLNDKLRFPFKARCITARRTSPLRPAEEVEVTGMAPEDECVRDMLVDIRWQERPLAVPLAQLEGIEVDGETREAIADWHYWVERGYKF